MENNNGYKFFEDLVWDVSEDLRVNENRVVDFEKTIDNLYADDELWQHLTDAIFRNLVEKESE